jgi:ABC-2 type transport system ATP-binding protein
MNAITTYDLKKDFTVKKGPLFKKKKEIFQALKGIDLTIPRGEIFSLLGPNGAGKTTTIKMLSTLLIPSGGRAEIMGHDAAKAPKEVRRILSTVLPGERTLFWKLTVRENLKYFADLYGIDRTLAADRRETLLKRLGIEDKGDSLVEKLSTGQRQKAVLIRALLPHPQVLLLDEPTLGLDPHAARNLREMVREIRDEFNTTILLTTHYMYEADELSDRVAIINNGLIAALDTPEKLKQNLGTRQILHMSMNTWSAEAEEALKQKWAVGTVNSLKEESCHRVRVEFNTAIVALGQVARLCSEHGINVQEMKMESPTLEDVFIHLTGESLEAKKEGEKHVS